MQLNFNKYIDQPLELPKKIKSNFSENEIVVYSLWDLNSSLEFSENWIVLTHEKIVFFETDNSTLELKIKEIKSIRDKSSLSLNTYEFLNIDKNVLKEVSFTNRQKQVMASLKYLLEESIKGLKPQILSKNIDDVYRDSILKNIKEKQNISSEEKMGVVKRLLIYLIPYKKDFLLGALGSLCSTLVSLIPAYISGLLVDDVIKGFQNNTLTYEVARDRAFSFLGILILSYIGLEFFRWIRLKKMSMLGEKVASDLRVDLYSHLQKMDMDFYSKRQTGSIISRVSSDTDRIWDFIAFGIVEVGIAIMTLLCLAIVLISLDWKLGLVMTLPVPFIILSIYLHGKKMEKIFIKCWRKWSALTNVLSDTIPGIQVVKAFNQQKREIKRFNNKNEIALDEFQGVHHIWTKFWPRMMLSIHAIILITWFLALPRLLQNPSESTYLSAGTFVSFLLYMTMFKQPIEIIGQLARMLNRATSSALRIFEILDTNSSFAECGKEEKIKINGDIKFKDVFFSYDGVRQVVKGISLHVRPGEMIGLVGSSGGGKSTLTKLLFRFYDVKGGEILVDDKNIKDLELGFYREQIGMVLQDPFLFHGSIAANISYGLPGASKIDIIKAAKIANAHDFIMKLPEGYETVVGERGKSLSGGEKQRVSIARAILHDPKILILDEATSAVDTETERKIQEALDNLVEGRTVIAIAHRLSTLRKANKIFVIKNGELVESGAHRKLMESEGEYFKLQKMQTEMMDLMRS